MRRLAVVLLALAGCGGNGPPGGSHLTDTPVAPLVRPRPVRPPAGHRIRFRATDGVRLTGTLYPAARRHARAVVLVHGVAGSPRQWDGFARDLHRAGFTALAYASRSNHETDEAVLARDVTGAIRTLNRRMHPQSVALAGASVGGSTVAPVLSTRPALAVGGVAFSGVTAASAHDLLLVTDAREAAPPPGVAVYVAPTAGHGSTLLRSARVRARAVDWIDDLRP